MNRTTILETANTEFHMKHAATTLVATICILFSSFVNAQEVKRFTLDEVIRLAEEQSPNALISKHRFRSSYWRYRSFEAEFRPSLSLTGTVIDYNRTFNEQYINGQYEFVERNTNNTSLAMQLSQNIGLTGGRIFISSDLTRFDVLGQNAKTQYITSPVSINITQPVFGYNSLKWQKKIEPVRYEQAQKRYISDIVNVHSQAVNLFFSLALAQINQEIAEMNYFNSDTLFRIATGRFNLGTIAEDELLNMELQWLNAGTARNEAKLDLDDRELRLRSFLGFNENVRIELIIPEQIPEIQLDVEKVLELAMENNPTILQQQLSLFEAQSAVAQARASRGINNANLILSYGMRQSNEELRYAYSDPIPQQRVRLGITVPIVDWGLAKGRLKMAQSSEELTRVQVEQTLTDFAQSLMLDVQKFNLQANQIRIAQKSDEIAMRRFEVTKQRFLIGRIDVLELNDADRRKDQNRRDYINSLRNYWIFYYNMRSLALYDFENDRPLSADFDRLVR